MSLRPSSPTLQHVVDGIYDAALDPGGWKDVIAKIAAYGRSSFATLSWREQPRHVGPLSLRVETGFSELMNAYYKQPVETDPFANIGQQAVDVPVLNDELEPRTVLLRSSTHARYLREWNQRDRAGVLVIPGTHHRVAALILARGAGEEDFDRESLQALADLSPHVRRSIQITARLRSEANRQHALLDALQHVGDGVFFMNAEGRVVFVNPAAEDLIARGVVFIVHQRLRAGGATEQTALDRLLGRATLTGEGRATDPGGSVMLHTADGRPRATLSVSPLRLAAQAASAGLVRAAVFVKEHRAPAATTPERLQAAFGLTAAEARVACELLGGRRLNEIAEQHGLSKETLRTQLRCVFEKTGVNRQAELVKVLMNVSHTSGARN